MYFSVVLSLCALLTRYNSTNCLERYIDVTMFIMVSVCELLGKNWQWGSDTPEVTIRGQTNSRSVKSRTGELAD